MSLTLAGLRLESVDVKLEPLKFNPYLYTYRAKFAHSDPDAQSELVADLREGQSIRSVTLISPSGEGVRPSTVQTDGRRYIKWGTISGTVEIQLMINAVNGSTPHNTKYTIFIDLTYTGT